MKPATEAGSSIQGWPPDILINQIIMFKKTLFPLVFFLTGSLSFKGQSQSSIVQSTASSSPYRSASQYKLAWQRLLLQLSSTYYNVVKEGQVDLDSSLLYTSRSLGLSRLPIITESIDDPELFKQSQWFDSREPGKGIRLLTRATGKRHLELLLLLGAYYSFQPNNYHQYKDSVEYFLSRAINESKIMQENGLGRQARCFLGKMYVQGGDVVKGDSIFNRLISECKAAGDREMEARALYYQGLYTSFTPATLQNRITYLKKAADIYHDLKNPEGEISCLTDIGYLYFVTFRVNDAFDVFSKAFQLEESIFYPYTHYNTEALAMATTAENKFGEPLRYTLETIKTAEATRDSIGWGYFYSRMGLLYLTEGGREEESLMWMQKALDRFIITGNASLYLNLNNMLDNMNLRDHASQTLALVQGISKKIPPRNIQDQLFYNLALSICYVGMGEYNLAEQAALKADTLEKQTEVFRGPYRRAVITLRLGLVYFLGGQYARARTFFERFLSDPSRIGGSLLTSISVYRDLIIIDSVFHDPISGLNDYKLYTQLLDSNFRVSKLRQAEELQVKYLTEEKENQITVLNQKENLEKANVKQANLVRNVTIIGIIGVLIIAGLLYRQNTLKQKNNNVITHKNEQLQHLLTEKEWLLKEIHHRVKNNLQIVMSLLNSQSAYLENDAALTAIHDSQHRVHAMSLIHQKLYNSENVSSINMSSYIRELVTYLRDSFDTGQRVRFELNIEPLEMDVSQAVPLGLILNEAITNSLKYAFPSDMDGMINISLSRTTTNHYLLSISDNGVGMPDHFTGKKPGSLGMSLMAGLSEDLDGNFTVENNNGTVIKISFIHDLSVKRPDTFASSFVNSN
jgi:two-component system, sensor histidine kinase PdtaS